MRRQSLQEIVNAPAEDYNVIAVNTGATSKKLVSVLNGATGQGIKVMSFDGVPPPIDHLTAQVNYDPVGAEKEVGPYLRAERLLLGTGHARRLERGEPTTNTGWCGRNVWAIGDLVGEPMLAHKANPRIRA